MNRQAFIDYMLARAKEPSTWRGVVLLLTGLGVSLKPEFAESIVSVGVLLAGGIAVAFADKPGDKKP
jgi:hypothetical protein